jgi:organic hydroperoxide reductase OsmC/OhrA
LVGKATGEVELDGKVLVIRRIHVRLQLKASQEQRATAERVHGVFADNCPLYRTLKGAIAITTELAIEPA